MPFRLVRGRGYAESLYLLRSQPTVGPQAPAVSLPLVYGAAFDHTEADRCEVEAQPGLAIPHHAGKRADLEPFDDAAEHGTYGRVAPVAVREPGAAAAAGGRPARTGRYVEAEVDGVDRQVLAHEAGGLVERRAGVAHTHRGIACRPQPQPELGGDRGARRQNVRLYATYAQASPQHRAVSQRRNDVATRPVARPSPAWSVACRHPARSLPRRSEPSDPVTVASCATKSLLSESLAPSTLVAISGRSAARTARARSRTARSSGETARARVA